MRMRGLLNEDINKLLVDLVESDQQYNFDNVYTGKVEDNSDPIKEGRCKIRVFGVYGDDINTSDLPWAIPDFVFIGSTLGSFIVPPKNAIVSVYFDNKDPYTPRYYAKVIEKNKLPKRKNIDYPNNLIFFETDEGDFFEINRRTGDVLFTHRSGTKIKIDGATTNFTFDHSSGSNLRVDGTTGDIELKHKTGSKFAITADGGVETEHLSGSKITIDAAGNVYITHIGLLTVGGSTVIAAQSGPLNCLPICPILGILHCGTICNP